MLSLTGRRGPRDWEDGGRSLLGVADKSPLGLTSHTSCPHGKDMRVWKLEARKLIRQEKDHVGGYLG